MNEETTWSSGPILTTDRPVNQPVFNVIQRHDEHGDARQAEHIFPPQFMRSDEEYSAKTYGSIPHHYREDEEEIKSAPQHLASKEEFLSSNNPHYNSEEIFDHVAVKAIQKDHDFSSQGRVDEEKKQHLTDKTESNVQDPVDFGPIEKSKETEQNSVKEVHNDDKNCSGSSKLEDSINPEKSEDNTGILYLLVAVFFFTLTTGLYAKMLSLASG